MAGDEIELNLKNKVFYHGTNFKRAENIVAEGFRVPRDEKLDLGNGPERYILGDKKAILGAGLYLTCNWKVALQGRSVLFRVSLAQGTRILNASVPPDQKILDRLRREFGHRILDDDPRTVLPKNKQLLLPELVALARRHFREAFVIGKLGKFRTSKRGRCLQKHADIFKNGMLTLARHYQFAGAGTPDDEYGIVIFMSERVILEELVLEWGGGQNHLSDYWEAMTLDQLKQKIAPFGTARAASLAERLALARSGGRERRLKAGPRSVSVPPDDWCLNPDVITRPALMDYYEPPEDTILAFDSPKSKGTCSLAVVRKRLSSELTPGDIHLLEQAGVRLCGDDACEVGNFNLAVTFHFLLVESFSSAIPGIPRTAENGEAVDRIEKVLGKWLHAGCVLLLELSRVLALNSVMEIPIPIAVMDLEKRGDDCRWEIVDFLKMCAMRYPGYPNPVMVTGESERYLNLERDLDEKYSQKIFEQREKLFPPA